MVYPKKRKLLNNQDISDVSPSKHKCRCLLLENNSKKYYNITMKNEKEICKMIIDFAEETGGLEKDGISISSPDSSLIYLRSPEIKITVRKSGISFYEVEFKKYHPERNFNMAEYVQAVIRFLHEDSLDMEMFMDYWDVKNDFGTSKIFSAIELNGKRGFFIDADEYQVEEAMNGLYPVTQKQKDE